MAPPKGKTAAAASTGEEPEAKKAKTEEGEAKKEEVPAFEEPDAPKDTRTGIKETITFEPSEMTLNAIQPCRASCSWPSQRVAWLT